MMDERAVTVVLGFILVLMMSMISLSVVQTTLVPDVCKKAEAEHMEKLTEQVLSLTEVPDTPTTVRLVMGVNYPHYLFLMTPSKGATSLSFEKFYLNLSYTEILPNGTKVNVVRHIPSCRIEATPNYYYYPKESLIIENSAVFRKTSSAYVAITKSPILNRRINVVVYNSTLPSTSASSPISLTLIPVSTGGSFSAENITLEFESINPAFWLSFNSSNITVENIGGKIRIKVNSGILSISELLIGMKGAVASSRPEKIYMLNPVNNYTLGVGETLALGVKIVDSFENPVKGVDVNVSVSGGIGYVTPENIYSDNKGEAYAVFTAQNPGSGTVIFRSTCGVAEYIIHVTSATASGSQVTISLSSSNPEEGTPSKVISAYVTYNGVPLPGYEVIFATNSSNAILNTTSSRTDSNGYAYVQVSQAVNGENWYRVYGYAGSVVDYVDVKLNTTVGEGIHVIPVYIENLIDQPLNGYQIKIVINRNEIGSIFDSLYTNPESIRVFSTLVADPYAGSNGKLPYWIESASSSEVVLWTKLDLGAHENRTVFVYFNKTGVDSESDGTGVFNWFDDFNGVHTLADYVIEDVGNIGTSNWQISNGVLKQKSNIYYLYLWTSPPNYNIGSVIKTQVVINNFEVHVRVKPVDNDAGGIVFNYITKDSHYAFGFCAGDFWFESKRSGYIRAVYKQESSASYTYLAHDNGVISPSSLADIIVRKYNGEIKVYQDGSLILSANDTEYSGGVIGLFTNALQNGEFHAPFTIRSYVEPEPKVTVGGLLQ